LSLNEVPFARARMYPSYKTRIVIQLGQPNKFKIKYRVELRIS
jgi:hypothetical protein